MKDGKPYMTFNVSEPQQQSQPAQVASIDLGGDDIPF